LKEEIEEKKEIEKKKLKKKYDFQILSFEKIPI